MALKFDMRREEATCASLRSNAQYKRSVTTNENSAVCQRIVASMLFLFAAETGLRTAQIAFLLQHTHESITLKYYRASEATISTIKSDKNASSEQRVRRANPSLQFDHADLNRSDALQAHLSALDEQLGLRF